MEIARSDSHFEVELDMQIDLDSLSAETAPLHRLVRDMAAAVRRRNG